MKIIRIESGKRKDSIEVKNCVERVDGEGKEVMRNERDFFKLRIEERGIGGDGEDGGVGKEGFKEKMKMNDGGNGIEEKFEVLGKREWKNKVRIRRKEIEKRIEGENRE